MEDSMMSPSLTEANDSEISFNNLKKEVDVLNSTDRNVRRRALGNILKLCENQKHYAANDVIWKPIVSCLSDPVEGCRELALAVLQHVIDDFHSIDDIVVYLTPLIVQRLANITEPSEEIRLSLVMLLKCIIEKSPAGLDCHLEGVCYVLATTILDSYAEIKKTSCICVTKLASGFPQLFHSYADVLIQPLMQSLVHQQSRVRMASVDAVGCVVMHGGSTFLEHAFPALAQRLLDPTPQVRLAVTNVVGDWLLNFPDRFSNFPRLISLLLTSMADEIPEISAVAVELWHKVGQQYEQENESELKDQLDYDKPIDADCPSNLPRSPVGCRVLVTRNLSHLLPAIFNDLKDWHQPARLKAAQLLHLLLFDAEQGMIQYTPKIIDGLIVGCRDDDRKVVQEVLKSAEVVGYFVPSDLWCPDVLEKLDDGASVEKLRVLAGLLRGSQNSDFQQHVTAIAATLVDVSVYHGHNADIREQTLACLEPLLTDENCKLVAFEIFHTLISILALEDEGRLNDDIEQVLDKLAGLINIETQTELCAVFAKDLLKVLKGEMYDTWTSKSTEWLIFKTLLLKTGSGLTDVLDQVLPILTVLTKAEKEHALKFYCFQAISHLFESTRGSQSFSGESTLAVVRDCVLPNLIWHPGKTAAVLRSAAISCLWIILERSRLAEDKFVAVFDPLLIQLTSCLRDEAQTTRSVACQVLDFLFVQHRTLFSDLHQLHSLNEELLRRMEDVSNLIRVQACSAIGSCMTACRLSEAFGEQGLRAHFEKTVRALMIYLDDPDVEVQRATLDTLKILSEYNPKLTRSEVEQVQEKCRNKDQLSELLRCIEALDVL